MNKALIITPTGCGPFFDDAYDKDNHWTFKKEGRSFETAAVVFNDYVPLPHQFDHVYHRKGRKWGMLTEVAAMIPWQEYDYIGYWDDDYATDIQSVEIALGLAREQDFPFFQQSLTSWTVFPILTHKPRFVWTETNFIELGVPFFRNDIFRKVVNFFKDYKPGNAEWGMDKIMSHYLNLPARVVHTSHIKHMRPESSYSKEEGFREMDFLMKEWYPKYIQDTQNRTYEYLDQQYIYRAFAKAE